MKQTLTQTIHDRARSRFGHSLTDENFDQFVPVWLECTREWRDELAAEGLTETARAIDQVISFNQELFEHSQSRRAVIKLKLEQAIEILQAPLSVKRVEPLDEEVLPDDYPVYAGYCYVVDGVAITSDLQTDVRGLKVYLKAQEVRRCDIVGRQKQSLKNKE